MYQNAMNELQMITSEGKNPHDDSADSITNMAREEEKAPKEAKILTGIL